MWYFRYDGHLLRGSRWGKIARFQEALSAELVAHGQDGVVTDGLYGQKTCGAIVRLCDLTDFNELKVPKSDFHFGAISFDVWDRLLSTVPPPTVHERAFVISLSHEGTDYDHAEWNFGTSDQQSVLTWGPYGATVGHGREVQAILQRVEESDGELLPAAFGDEFVIVQQLLAGSDGENLLHPIHDDVSRRQHWLEAFRTLGAEPEVRHQYDTYAFDTDAWLRPPIRRLYDRLIPGATETATAVDYGLFLDLAMHMSITNQRLDATQEAILAAEQQLGRSLHSGERRRVISHNMIPSKQQSDRLGRNVVFFVDDIGEDELTDEERNAWKARTGRRASDCGLNDETQSFPEFLS